MKAVVDQDLCIGCGLCADTCPEVFRMNDDNLAEAYTDISPDTLEKAEEARDNCPVEAITITD